jgi:hypothetical protein
MSFGLEPSPITIDADVGLVQRPEKEQTFGTVRRIYFQKLGAFLHGGVQ